MFRLIRVRRGKGGDRAVEGASASEIPGNLGGIAGGGVGPGRVNVDLESAYMCPPYVENGLFPTYPWS